MPDFSIERCIDCRIIVLTLADAFIVSNNLSVLQVRNGSMYRENENILLTRVRQGDVKAFEEIYHAYSPRLYGNMLRLVKSSNIAEELLQDVFQRVWEYRERIDPEKCFRSYIFTIAQHLVFDYFNKTSRQRIIENYIQNVGVKAMTGFSYALEEKETAHILNEAIQQLPPQRKLVYTLCKVEGRSYEDVSRNLGISMSTISDHIVKATKSIKAYYLSKDIAYTSVLFLLLSLV